MVCSGLVSGLQWCDMLSLYKASHCVDEMSYTVLFVVIVPGVPLSVDDEDLTVSKVIGTSKSVR